MVLRVKVCACLVLVCLLLLLMVSVAPGVCFEVSDLKDKAWRFITDVLMLDTAKYNVSVRVLELPTQLGAPPQWVDMLYKFRAEGSKLDITFLFKNGCLASCGVTFLEGTPIFAGEMPETALERARVLLYRYEKCFGTKHIESMRKMLDTVTNLQNMTKIEGNIKFWILVELKEATSIKGHARWIVAHIRWDYIENGIRFRQKSTGFVFSPTTWGFHDQWEIYRVGSAKLKVSREDAVRIAKEACKNFTYTVDNGRVVVGNFTILDEPLYVKLATDYRGNDYYTLYPFWQVFLCLDRVYPGGITGLRVNIWADTGEVIGICPTGSLAPPPTQDSQEEAVDSTPQQTYMMHIAAVATILAAATATTIILKKKHKKNQH